MTKLLNFISAVSCLLTSSVLAREDIETRLQAKTVEIAAELAKGPKLELPPGDDAENPPEAIRAAGEDFTRAWKLWRSITKTDQKPAAEASSKKSPALESINAAEDRKSFDELLIRTIEADPPPDPGEYARFDYNSLDWCADGWMSFMRCSGSGEALALLRKGKNLEALQLLARSRSPALKDLLKSFGLDPDEFEIGRWLNRACMSDETCSSAGEKAALMMLRWAELHWEDELERLKEQRATNTYRNHDGPYFSVLNLALLLRPDNGVTDKTKAEISRFIESKGAEMYPVSQWILDVPRGTEKWMVTLAKSGLTDELNQIRERSSRILTAAGIPHPAPELRPPPKFRISVNGKPWPGDLGAEGKSMELPGISFDFGKGGSSGGSLEKAGDGIFTTDPDKFLKEKDARNFAIANCVSSFGASSAPPGSPWLRAQIPLPIRFGEITDIDIETVRLAIAPRLPEDRKSQEHLIEVEFERFKEGREPSGSCVYHLKDEARLELSHVSPGDYWLRVRHPGTALMPWTKITVSKERKLFQPQLESGMTLVVPIEWPGGKMDLDQIPENLARPLAWHGRRGSFPFLELHKNGEKFTDLAPVPKVAGEKYPTAAIFANLTPGDYEVILPEIKGDALNGKSLAAFGQAPIKISIKSDDPVYIFSDPLKIEVTASSPGGDSK